MRPLGRVRPGRRGSREELVGLLWAAARRGRITAMKILLQQIGPPHTPARPASVLEELAARRRGFKENR